MSIEIQISQNPAEFEYGKSGEVEITVLGLDPGRPAKKYSFAGKVTLSTGEVLEGPGVVNLKAIPTQTVVKYELIDVDGSGAIIVQDPTTLSKFSVTVPNA